MANGKIQEAKQKLVEAHAHLSEEERQLLMNMPETDNGQRGGWWKRSEKVRKALIAVNEALVELAGLT